MYLLLQTIQSSLAETLLLELGLPIFTIFLTITVKISSRNKITKTLCTRDDLAIGLELISTSLVLFVSKFLESILKLERLTGVIRQKISFSLLFVLVVIFVLIGMSTLIRIYGWNSNDKQYISSIIIQNIVGIIFLLFVVTWFRDLI